MKKQNWNFISIKNVIRKRCLKIVELVGGSKYNAKNEFTQ